MLSCMHVYTVSFFFFNDTATTEIYTLSLHDALPIYAHRLVERPCAGGQRVLLPDAVVGPKTARVCTVRRSLGLEQRGGFGSGDGPRLAKGAGCLQDELDAQRSILQHQQSEPGESFWLAASHLVGIDKSH